jgi:hypothetical protein
VTAAAGSDPTLGGLVRRVRAARRAVETERHGPVTRDGLVIARRELLVALEDYIAGLERSSLPVPSRLRTEVRLHRGLFPR